MHTLPKSTTRRRDFQDPDCWAGDAEDETLVCRVCRDGQERDRKGALRHEESKDHKENLKSWRRDKQSEKDAQQRAQAFAHQFAPQTVASQPDLLADMSQDVETIAFESVSRFLSGEAVIEFGSDSESESDEGTPELAGHIDAEEEFIPTEGRTRMREAVNRPLDTASPYFPWRDRREFTLDLITHLPRSVLSERQLDLLIWSMKYNGVDDVPSQNSD
ncbi:hypothetical protein EXIGLDRAFT_760595 [Exidia glandulosa HHB12029]|uniref:Uncharacterized protein n=1 Tax=Exidia glandulosa HHB12029 TaxID=1314781 RepID=A0A165P5M6_EXIGL|nr:hypothetical protein EXIGLDRAFT_760595 [Exidia glandulosa HHB12029]